MNWWISTLFICSKMKQVNYATITRSVTKGYHFVDARGTRGGCGQSGATLEEMVNYWAYCSTFVHLICENSTFPTVTYLWHIKAISIDDFFNDGSSGILLHDGERSKEAKAVKGLTGLLPNTKLAPCYTKQKIIKWFEISQLDQTSNCVIGALFIL